MKLTFANSRTPISKKFSLDDNDELIKQDGGNLTHAPFQTIDVDINGLSQIMQDSSSNGIIIQGVSVYESGVIVTKRELVRREMEELNVHLVSRSKDFFDYRGGDGFLYIDYDPNAHEDEDPLSMVGLISLLCEMMPELDNVPMLWKPSSSSNLSNEENGDSYSKIKGQHIFFQIDNTKDIPRVADILYKRLWLAGHGYIFVDKTGRMHDRTVIDKVVNSPEREIFIKADCVYPVSQEMIYQVFNEDKNALHTASIENLTDAQEGLFVELVDKTKNDIRGHSDKVKDAYVNKMSADLGINKSKLIDCIDSHILYGNFPVKMSNGVEVTVSELFKNPEKYDGEYCYDPFEPDYGGSTGGATKAWINIDDKTIYTHAHGGSFYDLESSDRKSPKELALEICENKDHSIMFKLAAQQAINARYINTEIDQLIDNLTKYANLKRRSCLKAFNDAYRKITGSSSDISNSKVDLEFDSPVYDQDGKFISEFVQNVSVPIPHKFPHTVPRGDSLVNIDTYENFKFLCDNYGVRFSYDIILKSPEISFPSGVIPDGANKMNASMSRLKSLSVLNGVGKDLASSCVTEMFNNNEVNPVLEWIQSVKWDGKSRVGFLLDGIDTISYGDSENYDVNDNFTENYKKNIIEMWLTQCVAALDCARNSPLSIKYGLAVPKYEYILVFVGNQGIQKTKFIKSLLPNELNHYILSGHELDTKDKDNIKIAISHWITELGELDSTFRRSDISALKAFMSKEFDHIRMPYAPTESRFVRQTSFCASVNDPGFLVDNTGNRRYLPLHVKKLTPLNMIESGEGKLNSDVECQQLWAEVYHYYMEGKQWWPSEKFEKDLDFARESHDRVDITIEGIEDVFDLSKNDEWRKKNHFRDNGKRRGVNDLRDQYRFVVLNGAELARELGKDGSKNYIVSSLSNYVMTKGVGYNTHRVDGKRKKGFKLCVLGGVSLNSDLRIGR